MEISDVTIRQIYIDRGRCKALVSIVIDNALAIHRLKVIEGLDRLFVSMPSEADGRGSFRNVVHPINEETRMKIEQIVLSHYLAALAEQEEQKLETIEPTEDPTHVGELETSVE